MKLKRKQKKTIVEKASNNARSFEFMKVVRNILIIITAIIGVGLILIGAYIGSNLSPIDKDSEEKIVVVIPSGSTTKQIGNILKEEGLIKDSDFFYLYSRVNNINDFQASTYELSPNMSLDDIINVIRKGNNYNPDVVSITFQEGLNMRKVAEVIATKTNNTTTDVFNKLKDKTYLDKLIEEYWFITNEIKNSNIYYSLEGYLYPDTYFLDNKDVSVEEIFKIMLDEMGKKLTPYKEKIEKGKYSVHELLTIASITESEGVTLADRKNITSVFYNRLSIKMSLGSDVTTYYAFKVEMNERDLLTSEINTYNPYNTRGPQMAGKLPVGPVSNPSVNSIIASIEPNDTDYLYFVADKNRKVYFTRSYNEHLSKIQELKNKGVWFEW